MKTINRWMLVALGWALGWALVALGLVVLLAIAHLFSGCGGAVEVAPEESAELDAGADAEVDAGEYPSCAHLPPLAWCAPGHHCAITAGPPECAADTDAGVNRCAGIDGVKAPDGAPCLVCGVACEVGACSDGECSR